MLGILNGADSIRRTRVLRDDRSIDDEREMFEATLERNGFSCVLCWYRIPHAVEAQQSICIGDARRLKDHVVFAYGFQRFPLDGETIGGAFTSNPMDAIVCALVQLPERFGRQSRRYRSRRDQRRTAHERSARFVRRDLSSADASENVLWDENRTRPPLLRMTDANELFRRLARERRF